MDFKYSSGRSFQHLFEQYMEMGPITTDEGEIAKEFIDRFAMGVLSFAVNRVGYTGTLCWAQKGVSAWCFVVCFMISWQFYGRNRVQ